jgi:hypothetical protein
MCPEVDGDDDQRADGIEPLENKTDSIERLGVAVGELVAIDGAKPEQIPAPDSSASAAVSLGAPTTGGAPEGDPVGGRAGRCPSRSSQGRAMGACRDPRQATRSEADQGLEGRR